MIVNDSSVAVINAATTHPKEAQAFLNFIGRPKQQSLFAKISGGTSDYDIKSCNLDPTLLSNFIPLCKKKLVVSAKTGSWPNPNMGLGYLNGALQGLLLGSKSVDDVLKGLDYMWDNPTATSPPT
jgi:ABC-type glycerol-3-phosphate transport system substrate-binding protein